MSDKNPDAPGSPGRLRRDVEEKVDELELRLTAVERQLAERARLALDRSGGMRPADNADDDHPSDSSEPES